MGRYGITASGTTCEQDTTDHNHTKAVSTGVSDEYIFTVIVYGIVAMLRILEYFLLGKQFYYFLAPKELLLLANVFSHSATIWHCYTSIRNLSRIGI